MPATKKSPRRLAQMGSSHINSSEFDKNIRNIDMIRRRQKHLGGSVLFFHDPVHLVRGEGVWLYDDDGKKYLDCYNNVASVGHCHPHVVKAITKQAGEINTHTRYLHNNIIDYAEKLASTMPGDLEVCMFVCSGTEANELAMRIARTVSGNNGAIVMESSYHGNSTLISELSTALYEPKKRPKHVKTVQPPNIHHGQFRHGVHDNLGERYANLVDKAVNKLNRNGQGVAAFMCDCIFDSHGALEAPKDYFKLVYKKIRAAGGLCIADEVQPGLCRTGTWWGFENFDVVPDIVTLGKPMGDGHPVAAVVTTKAIAEEFTRKSFYFNTFGGNPVSAAAGKAVLEVCENENLRQHCAEVGRYLRQQLEDLAARQPIIENVRGSGMFQGVELVHTNETKRVASKKLDTLERSSNKSLTERLKSKFTSFVMDNPRVGRFLNKNLSLMLYYNGQEPAANVASQIPDEMKKRGIIIGMTGTRGNILKIRPPLVFSKENVDQLVSTLDEVLTSLTKN